MMKIAVIVLLIFLLCGPHLFSQTPHYEEMSLSEKDGEIDFSKLAFLKSELEKADIVLLGEPSHSPQFYNIKIQLVKYLHEQLDFDVLAFESGLYQMEAANSDIKKGESIPTAFENSLFPIWTSSEEFREIYDYLDAVRTGKNSLEVTGFDCQISGDYASKRFIPQFEIALRHHNISVDKKTLAILQAQFESLESGQPGLTEDFNGESIQELKNLATLIESAPALRVYYQSLLSWIGHFSDLYYNEIFKKIQTGTFQGKDSNIRDSLMAVNMIYLYEQLYPKKKIIGWGANGHFGNMVKNLNTGKHESKEFVGMGYHLKKKFGDKVFVLAVTTDSNYPNTVENELAKRDVQLAWISNLKSNNQHIDFSSCLLGTPASGNWSTVVDGILYFSSIKPDVSERKEKYFLKGKILDTKEHEPVSFANVSIDGTTRGTATDLGGEYFLRIDSTDVRKFIKISCIGFKTKYISVKELLKRDIINLIPEAQFLHEVSIEGNAPDAQEILQHAIENIPQNYLQTPFNMEFYSINTTIDTIENKSFTLESVFSSYYEGYYKKAKKNYRIFHKRESGDYYMKEKTHGMAQWPMWEVAFNDIFSNQSEYQIVAAESFDKIAPEFTGTELYDGDTVFVIQYNYRVRGTIYISSKDYAILKHITKSSGKGYKNRTEIIYKKQDGKYFPYAANGDYLHEYKVDGVKKLLKITNRTRLNKIEYNNLIPFEHNPELWRPKNITFDKDYWNTNYPKTDN